MNTIALTLAISALTTPQAQSKPRLNIGDPAPPLRVEAWLKGGPVTFKKGKVYVIEFWATWCGPCIQSMPGLSDLADKMKGKAEIISINSMDRSPAGEEKPGSKIHRDRIAKWVNENAKKMRYSVALDDSKNTMARTWLTAASQPGIPCAFVVDQKGKIAWIGHPEMGLSSVVPEVYAGKFDGAAARIKYNESMKGTLTEQAEKDALAKLAQDGDLKKIEKVYAERIAKINGNFDLSAVSLLAYELSKHHPALALEFVKNRARGDMKKAPTLYGGALVYVSPNFKGKPQARDLLAFSLETTNVVPEENAAIAYAYHARVLLALGDASGARAWLKKAEAKLPAYKPAEHRKNMKKYIDDSKLRVEKASG